MKRGLIIALSAVGLFVILTITGLITGYNSLVDSDESISWSKSQIELRLQERHDMLTGMIAAVQGLQEHEADLYRMITAARGLYDNAIASGNEDDLIAADAAEAAALADFVAYMSVEDNPDITVAGAYYTLLSDIELTEGLLAVARHDYNDSVQAFNTTVRKFPTILYASLSVLRNHTHTGR
ncbi:MAG: LemA family protein [bacterium]